MNATRTGQVVTLYYKQKNFVSWALHKYVKDVLKSLKYHNSVCRSGKQCVCLQTAIGILSDSIIESADHNKHYVVRDLNLTDFFVKF